jgi:hypothetical protein
VEPLAVGLLQASYKHKAPSRRAGTVNRAQKAHTASETEARDHLRAQLQTYRHMHGVLHSAVQSLRPPPTYTAQYASTCSTYRCCHHQQRAVPAEHEGHWRGLDIHSAHAHTTDQVIATYAAGNTLQVHVTQITVSHTADGCTRAGVGADRADGWAAKGRMVCTEACVSVFVGSVSQIQLLQHGPMRYCLL